MTCGQYRVNEECVSQFSTVAALLIARGIGCQTLSRPVKAVQACMGGCIYRVRFDDQPCVRFDIGREVLVRDRKPLLAEATWGASDFRARCSSATRH